MSILNITIDLISNSIIEIHGTIFDFKLLIEFENWLKEETELLQERLKSDSEWCELMLIYIPDETFEGRITAPAYYDCKILDEGKWCFE